MLVVGFANYRIRKSKIEAGGSQAAGRGCAVPAYAARVRVRPRILPPKRLWLKLLRIPSLPTLNVSHDGCVTCHLVLVLAFVLDVGAGARVEDGITPAGRRMPSQVSFSRLTIKIKMLPTSRMQNMKAPSSGIVGIVGVVGGVVVVIPRCVIRSENPSNHPSHPHPPPVPGASSPKTPLQQAHPQGGSSPSRVLTVDDDDHDADDRCPERATLSPQPRPAPGSLPFPSAARPGPRGSRQEGGPGRVQSNNLQLP